MDDSYEEKFRRELYQKYDACKKILIPKDGYYSTIEVVKSAATNPATKNRHGYYLLQSMSKFSAYNFTSCTFPSRN